MIALGIRYLTGHAVTTDLASFRRPEWPPHPGRVFMAMAAAFFETRGDGDERAALEWVESAPAPAISAGEGLERSFVETYVPVNDAHGGISRRSRQARTFPTVRPTRDTVFLSWRIDPPAHICAGLQRLCPKVTRVGHSSSLVQMWVAENGSVPSPEWQPDKIGGSVRFRIAERGTLRYLEDVFSSSGRPLLTRWQSYARQTQPGAEEESAVPGPFDPKLIILKPRETEENCVLGLETTLALTSALRNAALKALPPGQAPEWLSGHAPDGAPSAHPHLAFFPLPFVGAKYADGHLLGLAIAVPRTLPLAEGESRESALREGIGPMLFHPETGEERQIALWRSDAWHWTMERERRERPPVALQAETWTGPSRTWASVTPVVLHHYPKKNRDGSVERILFEAFRSALLPEPRSLRVTSVSVFSGAGHAKSVPEFSEGGAELSRYQTHVCVEFPCLVEGPVLVGRGRFRGYGLFRPWTPRGEA